jgi:hypothetical protein
VLTRKNQILLSFLRIRAVVNGKEIYPLNNSKPVVIHVKENNPKVVITDGYHFTRPLKLVYNQPGAYYFKVICMVSDAQLIGGFAMLAICYLTGFLTGILFFKIVSFLPVIWLLMFYYMNRKDFLQLKSE